MESVLKGREPGFTLEMRSRIDYQFKIFYIENRGSTYVIYLRDIVDYDTLDEGLVNIPRKIQEIMARNMFYLVEPLKVSYEQESIKNPADLGIPIDDVDDSMDEGTSFRQMIRNLFRAQIKGFQVEVNAFGLELDTYVRSQLCQFVKVEGRNRFADRIEEAWKIFDEFIAHVLHDKMVYIDITQRVGERKITLPVEYDWNITGILNDYPAEIPLRVGLIEQLIVPNISLTSFDMKEHMSSMNLSLNRAGEFLSILSVTKRAETEDDIMSVVSTYFSLGYKKVVFDIPGITSTAPLRSFVISAFCRLYLNYNEDDIESNITTRTKDDLNRVLILAVQRLTHTNLIARLRRYNGLGYEANQVGGRDLAINVFPIPRGKEGQEANLAMALDDIVGDTRGEGWMSGGRRMRMDINNPSNWGNRWYSGIEPRPLLGPIDRDLDEYDFEQQEGYLRSNWGIVSKLRRLLVAMEPFVDRSQFGSLSVYFDNIVINAVPMFQILTQYMRYNWYTGFRPTLNQIQKWSKKQLEGLQGYYMEREVPLVQIDSNSLLFLFVCAPTGYQDKRKTADMTMEPLKRRVDILTQLKTEMRFYEDNAWFTSGHKVIREWAFKLGIENQMSPSGVIKRAITFAEPGFFRTIIEKFEELRWLNRLPNLLYNERYHSHMFRTDLWEKMNRKVITKPEYLSLTDHYFISKSRNPPNSLMLADLGRSAAWWDNTIAFLMDPESEERYSGEFISSRPIMRPPEMISLYVQRRLKSTISRTLIDKRVMRVNLLTPVRFQLVSDEYRYDQNRFEIIPTDAVNAMVARKHIKILPIKFTRMYIIPRTVYYEDDYTPDLKQIPYVEVLLPEMDYYMKEMKRFPGDPDIFCTKILCVKATTKVEAFLNSYSLLKLD
jgi:hypothetical protein